MKYLGIMWGLDEEVNKAASGRGSDTIYRLFKSKSDGMWWVKNEHYKRWRWDEFIAGQGFDGASLYRITPSGRTVDEWEYVIDGDENGDALGWCEVKKPLKTATRGRTIK